MLVSYSWLQDFVTIPKNLDPHDLANLLTLKTAEVEGVHDESRAFDYMVTGQVLEIQKHPDADKLKIAKVSIGKKNLQIVCGGTNLKEGMYVAVALPGAKVKWHGQSGATEIQPTKIRGVESEGMIAAGSEINIEDTHAGPRDILDLSAIKPKPGTPLAEYFQKNDTILEFDNKALTHRPDLWGHHGIAREIAAITSGKFRPLKPSIKIPAKGESVQVKVGNQTLCPRYCGLIINNIKVTESPDWLKKRLKSTGYGIHNNIVDITNYVMAELGQPMHAFDKNYIKEGILVRHAKPKETITTLDGKKRGLDNNMLLIADHKKPVAIAGVMGGENSGITPKTTSIILESANFNAASIRRTSVKLGLRTEPVQRFEKSLDPHLTELAIKRAAQLILRICPKAKIAGPITDIKKIPEKPLKVKLDTDKASTKIGIEIGNAEIKKILEKLEFKVSPKFEITIPTFRASKDINTEDDLIEEIARIYGYDKIPQSLPSLPTRLPAENRERFRKHRLRELLSYGLGFDEVSNYSFYSQKDIKNCLLTESGHVKVQNYLSEDQTHLRTTLIPGLLKNIQTNIRNFDEFNIYEIGRTYKEIGSYMPLEEKVTAGAIVKKDKTSKVFYEAKGILETIFRKFMIRSQTRSVIGIPYAHPNEAISVLDGHAQTIAKAYTLHPQVAKNLDLGDYVIAIFELNFTELMKILPVPILYTPLSRFPSIKIDISVLVDQTKEVGTIEETILKSDETLITEAKLFDIYEGENIENGKKAIAFTITLRSTDRTLTDEDMAKVQKKIFTNLETIGGKIRGA